MATNTSRLGLLKKDTATDGNDTFNIKTMLNDNWDKIDAKVATLGADGKVPAEQLSITAPADASTSQKGVVQLEDSVTSTSTSKAATPNSVKTVNDAVVAHKADLASQTTGKGASLIGIEDSANQFTATTVEGVLAELFTSVSNGKTQVANAITQKGQTASGSDTFAQLATAISNINVGKKSATGTVTASPTGSTFTYINGSTMSSNLVAVTGLTFKPSVIIVKYFNGTYVYETVYNANNTNDIVDTPTVKMATYNNSVLATPNTYHLKGDVSPVSVTTTGFKLPMFVANGVICNWWAFE